MIRENEESKCRSSQKGGLRTCGPPLLAYRQAPQLVRLGNFLLRFTWEPRDRLGCPHVVRIAAAELFGHFAQYGVVVGRFVVRHRAPIQRLGRKMRLGEARDYVVVPTLRIRILFVHEGDAAEAVLKSGDKVCVWQIAFQSHAFFAIAVEEKDGRRPNGIKAMKQDWAFFDMGGYGKEVLMDEICDLLIVV